MEEILKKSVEQYQQIVNYIQKLKLLLNDAALAELLAYVERLQQLQDEASVNDERMIELYAEDSEFWQHHPLLVERNRLIEQIVDLNHSLLPKIRSIMAVVASELAQIKGGRQAVAGYHRPLHGGRQAAREVG